jgi:two-component system sensor histidine kinase KdpD
MSNRSLRANITEFAALIGPGWPLGAIGRHRASIAMRVLRFAISAGVVVGIISACLSLPHIHLASVVLILLFAILMMARGWGLQEAAFATILAAAVLEYILLPPQKSWQIGELEHWLVLVTFVAVSLITSYLAARVKRQRDEAVSRRREMEQLYAFGEDFPIEGKPSTILAQSLDPMVRAFQLDGAAYYDCGTGEVALAGRNPGAIKRDLLVEAAGHPEVIAEGTGGSFCIRIRSAGQVVGSLALRSRHISEPTVRAIAERIEVGLEKISAYQAQREAEDTRKSEALKSAVLDSLVHEIKTPVSVIKTAASSLLSRDSDAGNRKELLTIIDEETDHLNDSISQAFLTARIEAGILQQGKSAYQMQPLVNEVVSDLGALIKGRSVKVEVPDVLPPANFDFRMIKAVLKELLTNAVKYSPSESPLTVSVQEAGDEIVTSVADFGPGIRPDERDRIFEKHYRGAVKAPGSGLGLAFAKTIVEAHGGQIGVKARAGSGSVFYFSLPVFHEEAA